MKVLIKGAGDLATGIAARLYRSGFSLLMTEIAVPTTVRRMVAFSRAVYEGEAVVEDIRAILCHSFFEIEKVNQQNCIAVMVDEACKIRMAYQPDVLVDARIAKENKGTRREDASCVIGVGPGFYAGLDCHCVVETQRGHDLGRCIWRGSANPDTGVPGMIGGYGKERLIRATGSGSFLGACSIGDLVEKGQLLGYAGEHPIYAQIKGVVRGLLQDGVKVVKGMKAGDIDPRSVMEYCFMISDKATAIGGGVLEGIMSTEQVALRSSGYSESDTKHPGNSECPLSYPFC